MVAEVDCDDIVYALLLRKIIIVVDLQESL